MFSSYNSTYSPVFSQEKQSEDGSFSQNDSQTNLVIEEKSHFKKILRKFNNKVVLLSVIFSLTASHATAWFIGSFFRPGLGQQCMEYTSAYSPIFKEIPSTYTLTQFNGSLTYSNEYTADPGPEVDAVWEKLAFVKYASIPEEEFMKLPGADPDAARLTPEYGGGYVGFLEVSHHLHCLNMLRKAAHSDYYMDPDHTAYEFAGQRPWTIKLHLNHCVEMLRQNIMCNADVGIIPHQWIAVDVEPFANFNTWHKCRDMAAVEQWIHEHEIPDTPVGSDLPIPRGSKIYPTPP